MAIGAQRSTATRAPGLRKGTLPLRSPASAAEAAEAQLLARLRSIVSSAFYHVHATDRHAHAAFPFAHLELEEIAQHFAQHPHPALQLFVAALLLDKPRTEFDPLIDRLVGPAIAAQVRIALDARAGPQPLRPSGDWTVSSDPLSSWPHQQSSRQRQGARAPSRFAIAYEELNKLAHANQRPAPIVTFNGALPLKPRARSTRSLGPDLALPSDFDMFWEYDASSQVTHVRAEVTVQRPPSDFTVIADPQNWQDAAFLFFQCSELVELVGGEYVALPNPPATGSASYHNLLHEIVTVSFNPFCPMIGSNVLVVDYDHGDASHCGMECSLFSCLTTLIGASLEKGGFDVDAGSFHAIALDASHTRLISTKQVRFTERELCGLPLGKSLNEFAPLWLAPWIALLTFQAGNA
jgi:hypothetical protein